MNKKTRVGCSISYALSILIFMGIGAFLLMVKNPLAVTTIDASAGENQKLSEVYNEKHPYVKIEHMDLSFTGYYSVDDAGNIRGYYYMGDIGGYTYFTEVPAKDITGDLSAGIEQLQDYSFSGELVMDNDVVSQAASDAGLTLSEYQTDMNILPITIIQEGNSMERYLIYYGIALFAAIGFLVLGIILSTGKKDL